MANWIQHAVRAKGSLHRQLGISTKKMIPRKTLIKAAAKGGKLGQRARFAITVSKFHKR